MGLNYMRNLLFNTMNVQNNFQTLKHSTFQREKRAKLKVISLNFGFKYHIPPY